MRPSTAGVFLWLLVTLGVTGCSSTEDVADPIDPVETSIDESSVAYGYFGSVQLAQGSTINTTIQNVDSSDDVAFVEAAEGLSVSIIDDDDGTTRLEVKVSKDAPIGAQFITLNIAGEPEPVSWTIYITG